MDHRQQFEHASRLRTAGRVREALDEFQALCDAVNHPFEKAHVLQNVASCLLELGEVNVARNRLNQASLFAFPAGKLPQDTEIWHGEVCLAIALSVQDAEIRAVEGSEEESLARLNKLFSDFPKHLRLSDHREIYEAVQARRAFLLVDLERCAEAMPILEEASVFEYERSSVCFYLGHCLYVEGKLDQAKERLTEAVQLGLPANLDFRAHCTLGRVYCKLGGFARAKQEFELCAQKADAEYVTKAKLWFWLANTCRTLGLENEAHHYATLAKKRG